MIRKVTRVIIGIVGVIIGLTTYLTLMKDFPALSFGTNIYGIIASVVVGIITGLLFYLIEPWVINKVKEITKVLDK